ncbi:hypothetical protein ACFLTN_06370 [Chloroflexota bacterium]
MTTYYDTKKTADHSPYVVHFVKERKFTTAHLITTSDPLFPYLESTALEKLMNILRSKTIYPSPMPYLPNNPKAVCFTECIWDALIELADRYSPYGIVFSKRTIFEKGGGPTLYVRGDNLKSMGNEIPECIEALIAPFDPEAVLMPGNILDWCHEREWRLPHELEFQHSDIEYLIVHSIADANEIVETFGTEVIPRNKILVMEVYRTIRSAWGKS